MSDGMHGVPAGVERLFDIRAHDELVRSTVRLTRLALGASAASVFLYHEDTDELVFEASSGAGEDHIIGMAIPAGRGIAGWVWNTGETVVIRDVRSDRRFDMKFAEQTGFVPDEIMATPLETEGEQIGVLEVLDPGVPAIGDLAAMDLLAEIAVHCAMTISLSRAARSIRPSLMRQFQAEPLLRLEAALSSRDGSNPVGVGKLMTALADILDAER
jgi:GAF domain-containing protein